MANNHQNTLLDELAGSNSITPPEWVSVSPNPARLLTHKFLQFENIEFGFKRGPLQETLKQSKESLIKLQSSRTGDTCIVAGNGPSLNQVDWSLVDNLDVFASNYAFQHEALAPRITYLSVVNPWVAHQAHASFKAWSGWLFAPYSLAYWLPPSKNHLLTNFSFEYTPASHLTAPISTRSTVTYFNLQLAILMGYKRILLIGLDHHYEQPKDAIEGELYKEGAVDPNHFSQDYFAHKYWQAADVRKMQFVYALAANLAARHNANIINCSATTKLSLFPRMHLDEAVNSAPLNVATNSATKVLPPTTRLVQLLLHQKNRADLVTTGAATLLVLICCFVMQSVTLSVLFILGLLIFAYSTVHRMRERLRRVAEREQVIESLLRSMQ